MEITSDMINQRRPVVIITPVKNEEWILDRFLSVASRCADAIIVADQGSTDRSAAICNSYKKVTLIENSSMNYDENDRQILLIQKAREIYPGEKIILALDADEIIAANALASAGWQTMLNAPLGAVLSFEKPDLLESLEHCIRYTVPFPMGYVDDGVAHAGRSIHSIRIPTPERALHLHIAGVKILHYALTRPSGQAAKHRRYSVLENVMATSPFWQRRLAYAVHRDYTSGNCVKPCLKEWFSAWEAAGIDMMTIASEIHHWQEFDILASFARHGTRRFWLDDIWDIDWETSRRYAQSIGIKDVPENPVEPPAFWRQALAALVTRAYRLYLRFCACK